MKARPFPTQGRSLYQWALCVLLVGINLQLRGNRSQAPSFMAYKLEGGWEIWLWCLAAHSLDTVSLFYRGIVGAGCLVSLWTPWKTVFTGYGNTLATCLFLWDSLPWAHWLLVCVSVWAVWAFSSLGWYALHISKAPQQEQSTLLKALPHPECLGFHNGKVAFFSTLEGAFLRQGVPLFPPRLQGSIDGWDCPIPAPRETWHCSWGSYLLKSVTSPSKTDS